MAMGSSRFRVALRLLVGMVLLITGQSARASAPRKSIEAKLGDAMGTIESGAETNSDAPAHGLRFRKLGASRKFLRAEAKAKYGDAIAQTAGGKHGPDLTGCHNGCDYLMGFKCCTSQCVTTEMPC